MSYLLDKKIQRKKFGKIIMMVFVILVLLYFRTGVFGGLSYVSHLVFRPVLVVGTSVGNKFSNIGSYFKFKSSISNENDRLHALLEEQSAKLSTYNTILDENTKLKESLGRVGENSGLVLSAILAKPNQSAYDTIIIDIGADKNIKAGSKVFSLGGVPLGRIDSVLPKSSKVVLYSSSGEKTQVVIPNKDVFMQAVGRGGGNFEVVLPRDFTLNNGDEVVLPGIVPHTLAIVESIVSDPRDSFIKALLVSPVNIQEIKFVEVEM